MLPLCHDDERSAFLQFKESLIINESYVTYISDGVYCHKNAGHFINLELSSSCLQGSINSNSSVFNLVHLEWLNLAFNNFSGFEIPKQNYQPFKAMNCK
ncbi:hypothetical protein CUMW_233260, partial [Citrus unshiu]